MKGPKKSKRVATSKRKLPTQPSDNRQAIFDTAERLFGELGLEAVSVRDIAAKAAVNLGAINYYFGSRTNLLVEILRARTAELGKEREQLIAQLREESSPSLRSIVRAVIAPLARWRQPGSDRHAALMFLTRALTTAIPELKREIDAGVLGFRGLIDILQRALPHMSRAEICWRFHFMMSLEHMNAYDDERLQILSNGVCKTEDPEEALERTLDFVVAGFTAPARPSKAAIRKGS